MDSYGEILRLCRLCLVKDQVSIPIFDDPGDLRQIFFKISSCLPVKISQEDRLPKKICDGCLNKLDIVYEFWNSTANAEKTLLSRLAALDEEKAEEPPVPKPIQETVVKEEFELVEETKPNVALEESHHDETECPPSKRARTQINTELEEDDLDTAEVITKVEEEIDNEEVSFADMPSTSADDAQPGPSGLGKDGEEAPFKHVRKKCRRRRAWHLKRAEISKRKLCKCRVCAQAFATDEELDAHKSAHPEEMALLTPESGEVLIKEENIRDYKCVSCNCDLQPSRNDDFSYICQHCHRLSNIKPEIDDNEQLVFRCPECPLGFADWEQLEYHHVTCHKIAINEDKPTADDDGEWFGEYQQNINPSASSTLNSGTEEHLFNCNACGKGFKNHKTLVSHLKAHSAEDTLSCKYCGKGFQYPYSLKRHLYVHTGETPHVCNLCGKGFARKASLRIHSMLHTGEKPYICDQCGKYFKTKFNFDTHLRVHTGEKPFTCNECGKSFFRKAYLDNHVTMHSGEKPHSCPICGKYFSVKSYMKKHLKHHSGEKLYGCRECGKSFSNSTALNAHLRIHTGEKPYRCNECGKCFLDSSALRKHSEIHKTERTIYECEYCGKGFGSRSSLIRHFKLHTGDERYQCRECERRFKTSEERDDHRLKNCQD